MLLGVHALRGQLQMPPRADDGVHTRKSVPAWYRELGTRRVYKPKKRKPKQETLPSSADEIAMRTQKLLMRNVTVQTKQHV